MRKNQFSIITYRNKKNIDKRGWLKLKRPNEMAAALRYNPEEHSTPVVVATGCGDLAEKIIELAKEHGVPLYKDEALAASLVRLGAQVEIPPELYQTVAYIIAYIARLDRKAGLDKHATD